MASGQSRRIKDALVTLLSGVQIGGQPAFVAVLDNTSGSFDGYPSVRVLPANVDIAKASVAESERTVAYDLYVHLPLEAKPITESATYNKMYDLTDLIIDTLDNGDYDNALNTIDQSIKSYFLDAQRGDWMVNTSGGGAVLICQVAVIVRYGKALS